MTLQLKPTNLALPQRGIIQSADINNFARGVSENLAALAAAASAEESNRIGLARLLQDEIAAVRGVLTQLTQEVEFQRVRAARAGVEVRTVLSMSDLSKLLFPSGSPANLRAAISPWYGQATVPVNGIQTKFTTLDFRTLEVVPPENLYVAVTSTFDNGDGTGLSDHEHSGTVTEGTEENAFNGMNTSVWAREVAFDLDSDVDDVECELTVHVPSQSNAYSNTLCLNMHPWKGVDITTVALSSSLSGSFTEIAGFEEVRGAGHMRYFFAPQQVARVKIRLRQRNWRQKEGLKVFRYGLEEMSLQLIDWDKTWNAVAAVTANHTFAYRVDTQEGYAFDDLADVFSTPHYELEDAGSRHVHLKVCADLAGSTVYWDSDIHPNPKALAAALGTANTTLYVLATLNFVETSGGTSSPYPVGTPPYLNDIGLAFTVVAS